MTPRVSVIMVCRDGLPFLPETLDSLRAQTFEDWELIFRDNGSSDGSAEHAAAMGPRARVLPRRDPVPLGAARSEALAAARGGLLAFLDADDLWEPDKLARQVERHGRGGAALLYADCRVVDASGRALGRYAQAWRPHEGRVVDALARVNFLPLPTVLVERDAVEAAGGFDPRLHGAADYDLWLRVARHHPVAYDPAVLASYRVHGTQLTGAWRRMYRENAELLDRLLDEGGAPEPAAVAAGWAGLQLRWAWREAAAARPGEAARHLTAALRPPGPRPPWGSRLLQVGRALRLSVRGLGLRTRMRRARRNPET